MRRTFLILFFVFAMLALFVLVPLGILHTCGDLDLTTIKEWGSRFIDGMSLFIDTALNGEVTDQIDQGGNP